MPSRGGIAAVYGGYFGGALSVIVLASLVVAAVVFLCSGKIVWGIALVVAICALIGGAIGGAIASRVPAKLWRWIVIVSGLGMAAVYFARL